MTIQPIPCRWTGEAFVPLPRAKALCAEQHSPSDIYIVDTMEERSWKSHRHFFTLVNEAWANLPEDAAQRYPSPTHLRKWALVKAGFRDERSIVCASRAEALRVAAFVKQGDEYAVVVVTGPVVTAYSAKSQRGKAMDRRTFQASKTAVLDILADLLGVQTEALKRSAA